MSARLPIMVAMIELDEGPRLMANVLDARPGDITLKAGASKWRSNAFRRHGAAADFRLLAR